MDNKGNIGMMGGILAVIVGVAMIPVLVSLIDDAQSNQSHFQVISNSAFNSSVTLQFDDVVASTIVVKNASTGAITTSNNDTMRSGSEYTLNAYSGKIFFINRTGTWNVSYDYEPDTKVDSPTGRTVARQITLMYAVGLILMVLATVGLTLYNKR